MKEKEICNNCGCSKEEHHHHIDDETWCRIHPQCKKFEVARDRGGHIIHGQ